MDDFGIDLTLKNEGSIRWLAGQFDVAGVQYKLSSNQTLKTINDPSRTNHGKHMITGNTSTDTVNSPLKKRGLIAVLAGLIFIAIIVSGIVIRKHESNYYAPGRTLLVNAKIELEKTLVLEQRSIRKRRQAHREIEKAIADLSSVAEVNPQNRALITELLRQLKEIETADLEGQPDGVKLNNQYQSAVRQMDKLILKLEKLRP